MENGVLKELTKENLQELKEKRRILSDTDSLIICLLIERIQAYEKYFDENSIESIEKALEPYYEELEKLYGEED